MAKQNKIIIFKTKQKKTLIIHLVVRHTVVVVVDGGGGGKKKGIDSEFLNRYEHLWNIHFFFCLHYDFTSSIRVETLYCSINQTINSHDEKQHRSTTHTHTHKHNGSSSSSFGYKKWYKRRRGIKCMMKKNAGRSQMDNGNDDDDVEKNSIWRRIEIDSFDGIFEKKNWKEFKSD